MGKAGKQCSDGGERLRSGRKEKEDFTAILADEGKCAGCGEYAAVCQVEAIVIIDKKAKVKVEECVECGACVEECPVKALSLP